MTVDLLLGLQWGDEGKGKIVDVLTSSYDIIARFQGGPNAGHTLEFEGNKHVLHTIPSGIFHSKAINLIGNGVVIDPVIFIQEIENLAPYRINFDEKLLISKKAHLILPTHRLLDAASVGVGLGGGSCQASSGRLGKAVVMKSFFETSDSLTATIPPVRIRSRSLQHDKD